MATVRGQGRLAKVTAEREVPLSVVEQYATRFRGHSGEDLNRMQLEAADEIEAKYPLKSPEKLEALRRWRERGKAQTEQPSPATGSSLPSESSDSSGTESG